MSRSSFLSGHGKKRNQQVGYDFLPYDADQDKPRADLTYTGHEIKYLLGGHARLERYSSSISLLTPENVFLTRQAPKGATTGVADVNDLANQLSTAGSWPTVVFTSSQGKGARSLKRSNKWGHGAFHSGFARRNLQGQAEPPGDSYLLKLDAYMARRVKELTQGRQQSHHGEARQA